VKGISGLRPYRMGTGKASPLGLARGGKGKVCPGSRDDIRKIWDHLMAREVGGEKEVRTVRGGEGAGGQSIS